jgi:hypothetical protein
MVAILQVGCVVDLRDASLISSLSTLMEAISNTGGVTTVFTKEIEAASTSTRISYVEMEEHCVRETNAPCAHGMEVAPSLARTSSSRDLHAPRFLSNFQHCFQHVKLYQYYHSCETYRQR